MIHTASSSTAQPLAANPPAEQHTILQTLLLHLLPGAAITVAFILLGPWLKANNQPPMLAILIPILFVLIPLELGFLYYQGYRRNGSFSLEGIVLYRERLPLKLYVIIPLALLIWFLATFAALAPLDEVILTNLFGWLPDWFQLGGFSPADYSQATLMMTFVLYLLLNGIAGPLVEELYFRGYLLPRMEYLKGWAVLLNAALFSLYHFFNPWMNITRIIALIPMVYAVRRKRSIYISILAHCLLNITSVLLNASLFIQ